MTSAIEPMPEPEELGNQVVQFTRTRVGAHPKTKNSKRNFSHGANIPFIKSLRITELCNATYCGWFLACTPVVLCMGFCPGRLSFTVVAPDGPPRSSHPPTSNQIPIPSSIMTQSNRLVLISRWLGEVDIFSITVYKRIATSALN